MYLNQLRFVKTYIRSSISKSNKRCYRVEKDLLQTAKPQEVEMPIKTESEPSSVGIAPKQAVMNEMFPSPRVMPMVITDKDQVVLPFDDVPGPKSLKYLSSFRHYLSEIGTQLTAGALTVGFNLSHYIYTKQPPRKNFSVLFDEYGPVVRFVSPVGGDIVLINHPDHIEKVYNMEGEYPIRSTLDSLDKYRMEHRNHMYGGLYSVHGQEWSRQRALVYAPLHNSVAHHLLSINDVCDSFIQKVYNLRNYQDEVQKDLYKELHKWAFDCMGLVLFSKRFTMLDTELVYSQCDMSWLYHSLEKATEAIIKCETGLQFWKLFPTPAWNSLVKYCDSLDNLIGKHVLEAEQAISFRAKDTEMDIGRDSLINAMLMAEEKMTAEDIATILMDMFLIGVNTITSSMSFLLYHLAKYQRTQKMLTMELDNFDKNITVHDVKTIIERTPYLQACIRESLRLVPPIPIITRILPKNITLDRYNIPRGTLIIMSTQDASLKESNYDDATSFNPERWLKDDGKEYHAFASIPFGFGARKCLGQNIAEVMLSLMTIRILQKYKIEYHYGDIQPTRSFISKPNKPLKLRFLDRF